MDKRKFISSEEMTLHSTKEYESPFVLHRQIEAEQGFLTGSKTVEATGTVEEVWTDKEIEGEFDWDNN